MCLTTHPECLTLLHSEKPKLYTILAFLGAIGLIPSSGPDQCYCMKKIRADPYFQPKYTRYDYLSTGLLVA